MADWVNVEVTLEPLLEPVGPVLQAVDSVLSFLISILNIVQSILNVVKVFMVGLLDPLRSIVEVILSEIRDLIRDLRQLGLYVTGDWELIRSEDKFSNVLGGYQAYERRMLARLQDRSDPSRPDFASTSVALGAFFYVSSGDVNELVRVVNAFLRFFGQSDLAGNGSPYGRPTAPSMKYGADGVSQASFRDLAGASANALPDAVSVTWSMPSGTGGMGQIYSPAPKGFLVHVSTIPDGLNVIGLTPKDTNSAAIAHLPRVMGAAVDPTTNGALKLYGGVADLGVPTYESVEKSENAQAPILVLQKDQNTPFIKSSLLAEEGGGSIPLLANTYFVKTSYLTRTGPGSSYTVTFPKALLPLGASFQAGSDGFAEVAGDAYEASTFYFRIRALTEDYVAKLSESEALAASTLRDPVSVFGNTEARLFRFSTEKLREARNGVLLPELPGYDKDTDLTPQAFTAASSAGVAEFPSEALTSYVQAVQAAIALAVLCRADLTEAAVVTDTELDTFGYPIFSQNVYNPGSGLRGLEGAGRDLLARYGVTPLWFRGNRPQQFRLKMRWLMARVATDLTTRAAPPDSLAAVVVADAAPLLEFRWRLLGNNYPALTILESLDADRASSSTYIYGGVTRTSSATYNDESQGIGSNPYCRSTTKDILKGHYYDSAFESQRSTNSQFIPDRAPSFLWQVEPGQSPAKPTPTESATWVSGEGSADFSPIIYNDASNSVEYIRNALLKPNGDDDPVGYAVLDSAVAVLQLAAAPLSRPIGDTSWVAVRMMPQALAPLDDLLERLERFLQGVMEGLDGIIDKLVAYIESIQARIFQLQALLEQVKSLLRALSFFALPAASGLVVVGSGTDGLTSELVTSTNKPSGPASEYGAGVAIVAGGLPSVLLELLALILSGNGEEG